MAIAAVIGLTAGKRLLNTSFYSSELTDRVLAAQDHGSGLYSPTPARSVIIAQQKPTFGLNCSAGQQKQALRACKEQLDASTVASTADSWLTEHGFKEEDGYEPESSLEAILWLQKSMLEKQWHLSLDQRHLEEDNKKDEVVRSGLSARQRRNDVRARYANQNENLRPRRRKVCFSSPSLAQNQSTGYGNGSVSARILSHTEVINLCQKLKMGLSIEKHMKRLEAHLGYKPSQRELASYLRISQPELKARVIECSLAREKLAMSNVRLVMSVAQKYDNVGVQMDDLVQGGLLGLLRGIDRYDSSKGVKISSYVYWWIRQGISKVIVQSTRPLRLPSYLHQRLFLIRAAKIKLQFRGITPTIDRIAEVLNISQQKVRNATEADIKAVSLNREPFPSLNGLPNDTYHSYVADPRPENDPWVGYHNLRLKGEVDNLLNTTLLERERGIIRLYYGLDRKKLTWREIGNQYGLSREGTRKLGLVAFEKLKQAALERRLDAMYSRH